MKKEDNQSAAPSAEPVGSRGAGGGDAVIWSVRVDGRFHGHLCATSRAGADGLRDSLKYQTAPQNLKPMEVVPLYTAPPAGQEQADTVPLAKYNELLMHEHALSNAYVRLRHILGAMDPPSVSDAKALWAYVERVAQEKVAASQEQAQQPSGKNWHAHHVAVNKAALQMIRNALRNDVERGMVVRGEMLEELDKATFAIPAQQPSGGEVVAYRWMPSPVFKTWIYSDDPWRVAEAKRFMGDGGVQGLTLATPAPAAQPMTEEQLNALVSKTEVYQRSPGAIIEFARAVEAHHGITAQASEVKV